MDISGLGLGAGAGAGSVSRYPGISSAASISQFKAQQGGQLLTLLPSAPSAPGLGLGLNLDVYAAVGSQSRGLLSGGLTALEIANISLGIGMKAANPAAGKGAADPDGAASNNGVTVAADPPQAKRGNAALAAILKADGFVAPKADPYVVQKDFFPAI